jgi:PAS domain S-box-containing protein
MTLLHLNLQRLEDTAELGRALITRLPGAGLLIVDADLRILLADGDVHRDLPADIVGKRVDDVVPAGAWERLEPRYRAALGGELQTFDFDFEALGSVTVHALRFAPIRGDASVIGVMVLSQDITAQVRAIRQLADSERLQRSVLEVLDEGVVVVGSDGALVQANRAACAILGLELASALADPSWWEPVQARRKGAAVGATVMETGRGVRDVALEVARLDGTIVSLSANYQALRDETGAISGLVISFRDLSDRDREHRRLVESQERLREAHELARLSSWEWRPETDEVFVFHAVAPEDEALVQVSTALEDVLAAMSEDARQVARANLASIARGERDAAVQRHHYAYDAGTVWIETRLRAIRDAEGTLLCVRGTSQDVTEQELAKQEVTTQAALLEEVDVAVVATDPAGRITHWNRGARQLHGWTHAEMVGCDAAECLAPADASAAAEMARELDRSEHWEGEYSVRHKDGSAFPAYLRARVMLDADGERAGWIGVSVGLTKRLESERALRTARNYLRAVADSVGDGLFTLDTEGHVTYMNDAAERLLGWSRQELLGWVMRDVARARADPSPTEEWPVLNARRDGAARRIDDVFLRRDGCDLPVAYSAAPFETDDGVQGCVVVFEDISERRAHEAELEDEARKLSWIGRIQEALANDRFVLYGQPIVDLTSGAVVQSELLLRLREPGGEIIGPGAFLQIAEDYGLIGDIDRWVIARGAEIAATGRPVEVNVSAHSVSDPAVLDEIERCIEESAADPTLLVFEITETALIQDEVAAQHFAERLHKLGCKLALDDFGTGYGGFTYLKQLPLDFLKIDIEFVRDLTTNPASSHVVQAVVALARGFNLQTVAEGVEDAETLALLRELGVDLAQGYHIGRPGPLAESDAAPGTPGNG